jgi:hypothetical protein
MRAAATIRKRTKIRLPLDGLGTNSNRQNNATSRATGTSGMVDSTCNVEKDRPK